MVQNERGERFAVKVEGRGLRGENDTETQIMRLLNYLKGEASTVVSLRNFKNKPITEKLYTVTKIRKGKELFAHLYFDKNGRNKRIRSYQTRLNIALQSAYALQILHEKRIIHADVKPENFMADIHNNTVLIESIDYGLSLLLPAGKTSIELPYQSGTPTYMAPELSKRNPPFSYSFASDIYALGIMFSEDVLLARPHEDPEAAYMIDIIMQYDQGLSELVRAMKDPDPAQRPTLTHVINLLTQQLTLLSQIGKRQDLLKDLESYTKTLSEKKSKLKYSPLKSSKINKRLEQAETLALIISKKYQGHATEPAALQAILQDINDWRLPGKQISKLQEMIERLREINQEQVSIHIHMPHSRS